jgi:hypothetical protein
MVRRRLTAREVGLLWLVWIGLTVFGSWMLPSRPMWAVWLVLAIAGVVSFGVVELVYRRWWEPRD